jgi:hypothetical protein
MKLREGVSLTGCQAVFVVYFAAGDSDRGSRGVVSTRFELLRGYKKNSAGRSKVEPDGFAVVLKLVSLNPASQIAYRSSESSDQRLSAVSVL